MTRIFRFLTVLLIVTVAILMHAAPSQAANAYQVEINKAKLVRLNGAASSVIIADPAVADVQVVSPQVIYINGKGIGETTVFALDKDNNEILNATVTVTHNLSRLNKTIKELMPESDISFDSMHGALVMKGNVDSPLEAQQISRLATPFLQPQESLVNMLKVGGADQVMLKVRVAEVSRTELKQFGINLAALLNTGNFVFGLASGRSIVDTATGALLRDPTANSLLGTFQTNNMNINSVIDALENQGLMTVLAEPNLTALSGRPASFLAGGEFPIPVVGDQGSVTIEFRQFGVSLNFTPVVQSKDKITLTVQPEVSTLSQNGAVTLNGFNIPSLVTRRANTTVELSSGQSFAIAGLLQNDRNNDIQKFPGLGDLPVLGALFRSNNFRNNQTELVIIVTPYVVVPSTESKLVTAVEGYQPPNDVERILMAKLYKDSTPAANDNDVDEPANPRVPDESLPRLSGPVGFIVK